MDLSQGAASRSAYRRARLFETASASPFVALDENFAQLAGSLAQEISAYRLEGVDHDALLVVDWSPHLTTGACGGHLR